MNENGYPPRPEGSAFVFLFALVAGYGLISLILLVASFFN